MMSRKLIILFISLICVPQISVSANNTEKNEGNYRVHLKELMATDTSVILRSAQSEFSFGVPLSARMLVEEATLELQYTNSISLVPRSQLTVSLNDVVIAQVSLRARSPEGRIRVRLPSTLLNSGYNKLTLGVAQHYTDSCEDPSSPELWTQINTEKSIITFKAKTKPLDFRLNSLPDLIDRKLWADYQLTILTVSDDPSDETLATGSLVAQGAALLLDYVPLVVSHQVVSRSNRNASSKLNFPGLDWKPLTGQDSVLIGTREQLKGLVAPGVLEQIKGSYIGIFPQEKDPSRFILLISGITEADMQLAAEVMSIRGHKLPAQKYVLIKDAIIQDRPGYQRPHAITPEKIYHFTKFNYKTKTLKGMYPAPVQIRFWVAPDLFAASDETLAMHLHLAYGAGIDPQSTLNVFLNGRFEHAVHMTEPHGVVYYDYVIKFLISSLQPGWNEIDFRPSMLPTNRGGECQPLFTDNLLVTLFDDSYFKMDSVASFAKLPDLELISRTGFPYTMNHNNSDVSIQITETDSATISSAWILMAKLAQTANRPLLNAEIGREINDKHDHLIIIGREKSLSLIHKNIVPEGLSDPLSTIVSQGTAETKSTFAALTNWFTNQSQQEEQSQDIVQYSSGLDNGLILFQFESPYKQGRSVLIVSAIESRDLATGLATLIEHSTWGKLTGGMLLWHPDSQDLQHFESAPAFYIGNAGLRSRLGYYFSDSPLKAIITILVGILFFVIVSRWLLVRFRKKHHPSVDDNA